VPNFDIEIKCAQKTHQMNMTEVICTHFEIKF